MVGIVGFEILNENCNTPYTLLNIELISHFTFPREWKEKDKQPREENKYSENEWKIENCLNIWVMWKILFLSL